MYLKYVLFEPRHLPESPLNILGMKSEEKRDISLHFNLVLMDWIWG